MKTLQKMTCPDWCKVSVVAITKEDAVSMLSNNAKNRKLSSTNVKYLQSAMDGGAWKFNGDTIVRDCDGALKSGQHRLTAFVGSKLDNITIILVDLLSSDDVLPSLNQGLLMSNGQMLGILGVKNGNRAAAIVKAYMALDDAVNSGTTIKTTITIRRQGFAIKNVLDKHPGIADFIHGDAKSKPQAVIAAVMAWVAEHNSKMSGKIKEAYANILQVNLTVGSLEHSIYRIMQNYVSNLTGQCDAMRKTMNAIKTFFDTGRCAEKIRGIDAKEFARFVEKF